MKRVNEIQEKLLNKWKQRREDPILNDQDIWRSKTQGMLKEYDELVDRFKGSKDASRIETLTSLARAVSDTFFIQLLAEAGILQPDKSE